MIQKKDGPVAEGMKRIYWTMSIGLVGCKKTGWFDIEDYADDQQIDEDAEERVFQEVEWEWRLTP